MWKHVVRLRKVGVYCPWLRVISHLRSPLFIFDLTEPKFFFLGRGSCCWIFMSEDSWCLVHSFFLSNQKCSEPLCQALTANQDTAWSWCRVHLVTEELSWIGNMNEPGQCFLMICTLMKPEADEAYIKTQSFWVGRLSTQVTCVLLHIGLSSVNSSAQHTAAQRWECCVCGFIYRLS